MNEMLDRLDRSARPSASSCPTRPTSSAARWRPSAPRSRSPCTTPSRPTGPRWCPTSRSTTCACSTSSTSSSTSPGSTRTRRLLTDGVVDLADVVREEVRSLDGSTARVTVDAVPASVSGRRGDVALVVRDLLSNACRHARTEVEVTVTTASPDGGVPGGGSHGGAVRLLVDDDGPGIPPGDRERVFERFARLDEARTREDGGIGLGLAIVRAVAQRSGWTVAVDQSPAGGARVVIGMPGPT